MNDDQVPNRVRVGAPARSATVHCFSVVIESLTTKASRVYKNFRTINWAGFCQYVDSHLSTDNRLKAAKTSMQPLHMRLKL